MKKRQTSIFMAIFGGFSNNWFFGELSNINMITNYYVLLKDYRKVCLEKNVRFFASVLKPCSVWRGECYSDLQLESLTKSRSLYVSADLPGNLEDQRDPVHLFHLRHPESDRKDYIHRDICHHCYLAT